MMRLRRQIGMLCAVALVAVACGEPADEPDIDEVEDNTGGDEPGDADAAQDSAEAQDHGGAQDADEPQQDANEPQGDANEPQGDADESPADDGPQVATLGTEADALDETIVRIDTGDDAVEVHAKVAVEPEDRRRGLMEVEDLPESTGMLFVFEEERRGGFWMLNTLVPLDIAYSDENGEILSILQMDPCEEEPCPSYDPGVEYLTALEVPAGWFEKVGVAEGDRLTWDEPVPAGS